MTAPLPRIIAPEILIAMLGMHDLVVVDLCKPETFAQGHIPGAVHVDYARIVAGARPVMGLLPDAAGFAAVLGEAGITPASRVVAYDDEGGGRAARLLWTLELAGHELIALLDGGLHAWAGAGLPLATEQSLAAPTQYAVRFGTNVLADREYIGLRLGAANFALVDARTPEEYRGEKKLAARGGHIPGAVNFNWTDALDRGRFLRIVNEDELRRRFEQSGVTPAKEIVVYCQTHHRSAHTYWLLRHLGYEQVRGYPGSWSEWGNLPDTPVETG
jgi:thiosulfate/3-mercaptopyruvate sulfurtransferase